MYDKNIIKWPGSRSLYIVWVIGIQHDILTSRIYLSDLTGKISISYMRCDICQIESLRPHDAILLQKLKTLGIVWYDDYFQ